VAEKHLYGEHHGGVRSGRLHRRGKDRLPADGGETYHAFEPIAARDSERSIDTFLRIYPPENELLLRPLQILAAAQFELGRKAKARETFKRMQGIGAVRAEDRALVHGLAASLLEDEGKWPKAESEYLITIGAWREAGRDHTVDAGVVWTGLGALYVKEYRLNEAERTLAEAAAILGAAPDTEAIDHIHLLLVRSALYSRKKNWRAAEQDLADALVMADREPYIEPQTLSTLLNSYAWILRRNHQKRRARLVQARLKSLNGSRMPDPVVGVGDLMSIRQRR